MEGLEMQHCNILHIYLKQHTQTKKALQKKMSSKQEHIIQRKKLLHFRTLENVGISQQKQK
jgi:hypothetical protein